MNTGTQSRTWQDGRPDDDYRYRGVAQEIARMNRAIADMGLIAYVADCVKTKRTLPCPLSDPWRWREIAEDVDSVYASAAIWLIENVDPWQVSAMR